MSLFDATSFIADCRKFHKRSRQRALDAIALSENGREGSPVERGDNYGDDERDDHDNFDSSKSDLRDAILRQGLWDTVVAGKERGIVMALRVIANVIGSLDSRASRDSIDLACLLVLLLESRRDKPECAFVDKLDPVLLRHRLLLGRYMLDHAIQNGETLCTSDVSLFLDEFVTGSRVVYEFRRPSGERIDWKPGLDLATVDTASSSDMFLASANGNCCMPVFSSIGIIAANPRDDGSTSQRNTWVKFRCF